MKEEFLELLERDKEFRYAVAGKLGLEEILRRLDRHEEHLTKLREDMVVGFRRHDEISAKLEAQLVKLREDMVEGFKRYDEILARHEAELVKLREDLVAGFRRHDEEIARLRADMMEGFNLLRRHLEALGARWSILAEEAFREG